MSFVDRLSNSWNIFKTSVDFLKRDKSLMLVPVVGAGFILAFLALFFFFALPFMQYGGWWLMILFLFIINIIAVFFASVQVWMVYEVALGKDATLSSGFKRAFGDLWDIFFFVVASLIIGSVLRAIRQRGGIAGEITSGVVGVFVGIAQKLVIPAMIISERNFWDSVKGLGKALKAAPEIAVYEIGVGPLLIIAALLWAGFSFLVMLVLGLIPAVVVFFIGIVLLIYVYDLIDKIYYTLLYLTLIEKKKVKGLKLR